MHSVDQSDRNVDQVLGQHMGTMELQPILQKISKQLLNFDRGQQREE
jgi:hypothetical protein